MRLTYKTVETIKKGCILDATSTRGKFQRQLGFQTPGTTGSIIRLILQIGQ